MHPIKNAARILGVSERTIRRWIKQDNVNVEILHTDRNRVYIHYNDLHAMANKHQPLKLSITNGVPETPEQRGLYSIKDVASILGASEDKVREWVKGSDVEEKVDMADGRRVYVSYSDLVMLARKYNRVIPSNHRKLEQGNGAQEDGPSQESRLYTLAEAALYLGVAECTVRSWLSLYNVEKRTVDTDKQTIYIAYSDIMMLAAERKCESGYPIDIATDIREMRDRLGRIEERIRNMGEYLERTFKERKKCLGW